MKRIATVLAASFALAAPGTAGGAGGHGMVYLSGGVELTWKGRTGSCEAVGLCGVVGSAHWSPDRAIGVEYLGKPGSWAPDDLQAGGPPAATVRVIRDEADGTQGTCLDKPPGDLFQPAVSLGADGGGPSLTVGAAAITLAPFSLGRCAGPLLEDFNVAFPSVPFRRPVMNLGARRSFAAGPFAGEFVSTLRIRVGRISPHPPTQGSAGGDEAPRFFQALRIVYEVIGASGGLGVEHRGVDETSCSGLDACGATGRISYGLSGLRGRRLVLQAVRLPPVGRQTKAQALRALRAGRLHVGGHLSPLGTRRTTTQTVSRLGAIAECNDASTGRGPYFFAHNNRGRWVNFSAGDDAGGQPDPLRTRCPGPGLYDVIGERRLLDGRVEVARVGDPELEVAMTSQGTFDVDGWSGTHSGSLGLQLRLRSLAFVRVSGEEL